MKIFLLLLALDALFGVVTVVVFFTLKRKFDSVTTFITLKSQGRSPLQVSLRTVIQLLGHMKDVTVLERNTPAWSRAQGLTIFEELHYHRKYRQVLSRECGTDDIGLLIEAMDLWQKLKPRCGSGL